MTLATDKRTYCEDLVAYVRAERKDNTPPKTIQSRTAGVKKFIRRCSDVELDESQRDELKEALGKDHAAVTDKELLDRNTLREILSHLDMRMKALFLFLESSGARIGETLQLRDSDLHLNQYPAAVHIRAETTKTKKERWVFISTESKEPLLEWFKGREGYLLRAAKYGHNTEREMKAAKPRTEDVVFPWSYTSANEAFRNAMEESNHLHRSERSRKTTICLHGLGRWFRTQAVTKIDGDLVEFLMGHQGRVGGAYDLWSVEQLGKEYRKAESALLLNVGAEKLEGLEEAKSVSTEVLKELKELKERQQNTEKFLEEFQGFGKEDLEIFRSRSVWEENEGDSGAPPPEGKAEPGRLRVRVDFGSLWRRVLRLRTLSPFFLSHTPQLISRISRYTGRPCRFNS